MCINLGWDFVTKLRKYFVASVSVMFIAVVVMVSALRIAPEVRQKFVLEANRDHLIKSIHDMKKEISDLRAMQHDFKSDHEFIEYILHENNHVWKNETIFIFEG